MALSEKGQAALAYLADEWSVFPICSPGRAGRCLYHNNCSDPGKVPMRKWGLYQDQLPTREEVIAWWSQWPDANIALATGQLSNVVVIDLDGELAQAEAARRGYDPGPYVNTGRIGGKHLYFRWREGAPTIFAKTSGLDFRGDGGFVCLPPSRHKTGVVYQWGQPVQRGEPLPDLPMWINDLASMGRSGGERRPIDFEQLYDEGIPEGERDQQLFRSASKLRAADVPYGVAVDLIVRIAERCRPPFPSELAVAKVNSAYMRYLPNLPPPPEPSKGGLKIWTAIELGGTRFDAPRQVIPSVLTVGSWILGGRPKLGKSWLSLNWCNDIAGGGLAMGRIEVEQGETLYLALEDNPRRMQERLALVLGDLPPPPGLHIATDWPRMDVGGLDLVEKWLIEHPAARLVVIDTFAKFKPQDQANRQRNAQLYDIDYNSVAPLGPLAARYNVAIVLVMHTRKGQSDDPLELVSGTLGLTGAADGVLVLKRERGRADASLFITGRDVEEQDLALKFETDQRHTWSLLGNAAEYRISQERATILAVINHSSGVTPAEIAAVTGMKSGNARKLLFSMVRDAQVRVRDNLYYPWLLETASPTTPSYGGNAGRNDPSGGARMPRSEAHPQGGPATSVPTMPTIATTTRIANITGVTAQRRYRCKRCGRMQHEPDVVCPAPEHVLEGA